MFPGGRIKRKKKKIRLVDEEEEGSEFHLLRLGRDVPRILSVSCEKFLGNHQSNFTEC